MSLRALLLAWMLVFLALPVAHSDASDGWFGSSSKPAANGVTTSAKKSGVSAWLPSWPVAKPKAKSNKPSMVSSMATGTKNAFTKTVSFLNPFDNPPKSSTPSDTGANSSSWWSTPKSKDSNPASVGDWMRGEKPKW